MADTKSIQIYLKEKRSEIEILGVFSSVFGFSFDSTEIESQESLGFIQIIGYTQGFKQGLLVTWPNKASAPIRYDEAIKTLSVKLSVDVLLEPNEQSESWVLSNPNGYLTSVNILYLADGIDVEKS